ncbi:hypothetical protein BKA70DRAFT_1253864 [Coprinopsis sp. MPI-PUGE-AT-0042]|nr:hypothetical protein BKA70DRAFT_1253864 [Coprinopsis sp. MPI-PUGE-AT-0042]
MIPTLKPQPFMQHKVNPSWLAVKELHNMTISSDQWFDVFGNIVLAQPVSDKKTTTTTAGGSSTPPALTAPTVTNGKRLLGSNGDSGQYSLRTTTSKGKAPVAATSPGSSLKASTDAASAPLLPPLPEPGPFDIHITCLELPVLYEAVLDVVPNLHSKPPKLPTDSPFIELPPDFPEAPENGYDFIFHVGVAGRGPLRMEIIGHKFGYTMKDASGSYCAVVPPPSLGNKNPTRGPGAGPPPPPGGPMVVNMRGGPAGNGFGNMGMGYNNERLGYNPAVHDPQPIPGTENSVRPVRGFGTAYESFPDEMMTDIDVTRLVQDLKSTGITKIYTSMDAGHYLCDFTYYCSLAESKRSSKALLPYMAGYPGQAGYYQQPYPQPPAATQPSTGAASSPSSSAKHLGAVGRKPARVLFMHCPPVKEPLSTEEVTEAIRRIVLWVCRECEVDEIREAAQAPEEGAHPGAPVY